MLKIDITAYKNILNQPEQHKKHSFDEEYQ